MAAKKPKKLKMPYLEQSRGFWWYRPYIPVKQRAGLKVDSRGRLPAIRLCSTSEPEWVVREAHAAAMKSLNMAMDEDMHTLGWMNKRYLESSKFTNRPRDSQRRSLNLARVFDHPIELNGRETTLSKLHPSQLTKPMLRVIMDDRYEAYIANGKQGGSQCNRELSHISVVYKYNLERVDEFAGVINPTLGMERFPENVNDRYVTDAEYFAQWTAAFDYLDYLPVVFELAYLTAARGIEVTELMLQNIVNNPETGGKAIKVERRKGSKTTYINVTPRLQAAIDAAKALHRKRKYTGMYLVPGARSAQLNKSTLETAMNRLAKRMKERGCNFEPWTLHDLKRKGISDSQDKRIAGHLTEAMRQRYDVKIHAFDAPA